MKNYDNIIWYAWNYDYKFIEKCWDNNKSLANHLQDKFNHFMSKDRRNGFFTFVSELDSGNREKLYAYIDKTFSKEKGHLDYNGYTNYETWNVALWIDNHQWNYATALQCKDYSEFVKRIETTTTGDGVEWTDPLVNVEEINELIFNDR